MNDASVLDLGLQCQPAPSASRPIASRRSTWIAGLACVILALAAISTGAVEIHRTLQVLGLGASNDQSLIRAPLDDLREVSAMSVDDKGQIVAQGLDAQSQNAALPVSGLPLEQAKQFDLKGSGAETYATALKCLTQAVYYEAANEPLQGRRAVAQVVLNRLRHPAYPKSVCGVVYQGSERRTGCQFSFTCDGSLLRGASTRPWNEAAAVARAALSGRVEARVGTATHYHADYVLPKWAFQLGKIDQINRHIFYRFKGSWGMASAFTGRYSGFEQIPPIDYMALRERYLDDGLVGEALVAGLTVAPHVTDRHAEVDVGGRIDVTKQWRLSIPDPLHASSRYRQVTGAGAQAESPVPGLAAADRGPTAVPQ